MTRKFLLVSVLFLAGCAATPTPQASPSTDIGSATSTEAPAVATSAATIPAYLLNPNVTQANIQSTICVSGWTATIRPSSTYTTNLKKTQLAALGYADQNTADYEEDHWIPLELGGNPTDPHNLWPELWADARKKDVSETADKKAVCAGTMTLADARLDMYRNWHK